METTSHTEALKDLLKVHKTTYPTRLSRNGLRHTLVRVASILEFQGELEVGFDVVGCAEGRLVDSRAKALALSAAVFPQLDAVPIGVVEKEIECIEQKKTGTKAFYAWKAFEGAWPFCLVDDNRNLARTLGEIVRQRLPLSSGVEG